MIQKKIVLFIFLVHVFYCYCVSPWKEQFKQVGYIELCDTNHQQQTFDNVYLLFDEFIEFLQKNPTWKQKLYTAKERFIRSKDRNFYSTEFFGFYDESEQKVRRQISFYYSVHFHTFICSRYPEFNTIPQLAQFLNACRDLQKPYPAVFKQIATELGIETIFSSPYNSAPLLLKVVKYLPSYTCTKPHYDGTAFSLFLNSTDDQALRLSPYKSAFTAGDFITPARKIPQLDKQNGILLIPGTLLTEFSIYPTPHIVIETGKTRYATIAFAMRPQYSNSCKQELSALVHLESLE